MTAQLFDLGVRLRAAATGRPQPRVARPLWAPRGALVAAHCARADDGSITVSVARPGGATATSLAPTGLLPLAHDDESSRGAFECLVVADRLQLALLMEAAKATPPGVKADRAAATVAWWVARADHPGTGAVLIATEAARQRLVLADPDAERSVGAWLRALGRPVPADHVEAPLALVDAVADGAKGVEGVDDQREWRRFCTGYDAGYNWRGPDTAVAAAVGLRAREDASELFARALLDDPAWAQRERFAGRVVVGTVERATTVALKLRTDQGACHFRPGARVSVAVAGWVRPGELIELVVRPEGGFVLECELASARGKAAWALPTAGSTVYVLPERPDPARAARARVNLAKRYGNPSWLHSRKGEPRSLHRDVPLDVLVAAAEED